MTFLHPLSSSMKFIQITNSPDTAAAMDAAGVDRVMIDLERRGKLERQGSRDTWISHHTLDDIAVVRPQLAKASLLVRVDPWGQGSNDQVDDVIARGADVVMLPMLRERSEAEAFIAAVDGRAKASLLLETAPAIGRLDDILECAGIDEVHIGLNDLHVEMNLAFMFELLAFGMMDFVAARLRGRGIPFGIGGVAPEGAGPISAQLILSEHARLGSTACILSRGFLRGALASQECLVDALRGQLAELRTYARLAQDLSADAQAAKSRDLRDVVKSIVARTTTVRNPQTGDVKASAT